MLEVGFSTTTGGGPCFCTHFRKAGNYSVMMVNEVRMKGGHVQSHSRADLLPCSHISGTPLAQWMVETTRIDAGSAGAADCWNVSRIDKLPCAIQTWSRWSRWLIGRALPFQLRSLGLTAFLINNLTSQSGRFIVTTL